MLSPPFLPYTSLPNRFFNIPRSQNVKAASSAAICRLQVFGLTTARWAVPGEAFHRPNRSLVWLGESAAPDAGYLNRNSLHIPYSHLRLVTRYDNISPR